MGVGAGAWGGGGIVRLQTKVELHLCVTVLNPSEDQYRQFTGPAVTILGTSRFGALGNTTAPGQTHGSLVGTPQATAWASCVTLALRVSGRHLAGTDQPLALFGVVLPHHRAGCLVRQKDYAGTDLLAHRLNQAEPFSHRPRLAASSVARSQRQPSWAASATA